MVQRLIAFILVMACLNGGAARAATPSVTGRLLFDGQLFSAPVQPSFWFRNEITNQVASAQVEVVDGRFTISGLPPGNYGVSVTIDLNQANAPGMPGDFSAWKHFSVNQGMVTNLDIPMTKLIHLTSPVDNANLVKGRDCDGMNILKSPVKVAWEPVVEHATYDYAIITADCMPFKYGGVVASGTTNDLSELINLPPNKWNQMYLLKLGARRNGHYVGSLQINGATFYGWDYRFRIKKQGWFSGLSDDLESLWFRFHSK
ncbi:carboxypeptidase-like regulatory domain-containing protein [Trichlorobacter lovleyi]|uniref:carboxypeptidase-like regulatory domain-containing protein n=1 Tax=Trichlorobacter lovleyi TaxID=313985 RepID=UPI0023F03E0E|nr:carboxypeptidase-like regulatory domain-containing protein [Trichlorobacter lovleyi]